MMQANGSNGQSARQFSEQAYAGAQDSSRRRKVAKQLWSEDRHLPRRKRVALNANIRDQIRNFAVACWMVRKHLDYVTRFNFQAKTPDEGLNTEIERLIARRGTRFGCDVALRHPLGRLLRVIEARSVVDGDVLVRRLAPKNNQARRGKLQLIESELICECKDTPAPRSASVEWVNGVLVGDANQSIAYSIVRRKGRGTEFAGLVDAREAFLHAYHESSHRNDQVRGTSAFASAINSIRDASEGFDWMLFKLKIHQMFGLKIRRSVDSETGYATGNSGSEYEVDLSKGPFQLDMDPGDDASFLESGHPAEQSVEFLQLIIHIALKALDLPYSFFREDFTNFFGSRAALLHYLRSCAAKIEALQELLNWLTFWWLGLAVVDGELDLGRLEFGDLAFEWVPQGVPWWDPSKEISGNLAAIGAGLDNFERVCRSTGTDFKENVRINAQSLQYAASQGFPLSLGSAAPATDSTDDADRVEKPEQ